MFWGSSAAVAEDGAEAAAGLASDDDEAAAIADTCKGSEIPIIWLLGILSDFKYCARIYHFNSDTLSGRERG